MKFPMGYDKQTKNEPLLRFATLRCEQALKAPFLEPNIAPMIRICVVMP